MGRGDQTVPVVESWTILVGGRRRDVADHGRPVRDQRHEPPPGRPRPDGVHAPDRQRRPAHPRASASAATRTSTRPRHHVPGGARAGRPARGGRRRPPGAVDRRSGDPAVAVLPARRGVRRARSRSRAAASSSAARRPPGRGWRAGSATAGRPSTTTSRRTCRSTSRRSRRPAGGGPTSSSSSASRATTGSTDGRLAGTGWVQDPRETWERWKEVGADGAIVTAKAPEDIDALVDAVERW